MLFATLARAAERRVGDFIAMHLANTAWVFATASQSETSLLVALARAVERHIGDFDAQDFVKTAWAFTKLGKLDAPLFMG